MNIVNPHAMDYRRSLFFSIKPCFKMNKFTKAGSSVFFLCAALLLLQNQKSQGQNPDADQVKKGMSLSTPELVRSAYIKESPKTASTGEQLFSTGVTETNFYFEDFESASSWTLTGDWETGTPSVGPMAGYNSTNALATNLDGNYSDNSLSDAVIASIDLSAVTSAGSSIYLEFYEWLYAESCCDDAQVLISTDNGANWTELRNISGNSNDDWRKVSIDLTAYMGLPVSIAFRFTSDGSVSFSGWHVDDVRVYEAVPLPLAVNIVSLDAQNFPFIYLNVRINAPDLDLTALNKEHFIAYENGVEQTDFFDVILPQQSGGTRRADIVFLMDNSGSMSEEQNAIEANVTDFVNNLSISGVDFALGLCRYGDTQNSGYPIIEDNGILTSDIDYFINNLWQRNTINGGFEPGWDALYQSVSSFSFRPGSQKIFVLITDESVTGDGNMGTYTKQHAIDALNASTVSLYSLIEDNDQYAVSDFGEISEATDAKYYNIYSNFDAILEEIEAFVSNTYLVTYRSSRPVADGTERLVRIEVDYLGESDFDEDSYVAGNIPKIQRTDETKNLSLQAWLVGTEFTIETSITDNAEPYTTGATLYYKASLENTYESVSMTFDAGSNNWSATIPATSAYEPGVDYYITATDGENTSSSPTVDPSINPFQIAVLPNIAPEILHSSPFLYEDLSSPFLLEAEVTDDTNILTEVSLYYRRYGHLIYNKVEMSAGLDNVYSAFIPGEALTENGIEYFIYAVDDFGVSHTDGTVDIPHFLVYIAEALAFTLSSTNPCSTGSNGSIEVAATGGGGSYTYSLDNTNFSTSNTFTMLAAGVYTVYVKGLAPNVVVSKEIELVAETDTEAPAGNGKVFSLPLGPSGQTTVSASIFVENLSDNCNSVSSLTVSASKTFFTCADIGTTHTINVTAADQAGNTSAFTSTVTITDASAPIIAVNSFTATLTAEGKVIINPADAGAGSADNCTPLSDIVYTLAKTDFTCEDVGDQLVNITARDAAGNTASKDITITIIDAAPPVVTLKDNILISLDATGHAAVAPDQLIATIEDCTSESDLVFSLDQSTFDCASAGENIVNLTVEDASGNITTEEVALTVADDSPPHVVLKTIEVVVEGGGTGMVLFDDIDNGTTDNCTAADQLVAEISPSVFSCDDLGEQEVVVKVTDNAGNSSEAVISLMVSCSLTSGLPTSEGDVRAFPNPTTQYLRVESNKPLKEIFLHDLTGKYVKKQPAVGPVMHATIDLSELKSGIYFLEVRSVDGKKEISRIIKQ